jgi:hypothetical protein
LASIKDWYHYFWYQYGDVLRLPYIQEAVTVPSIFTYDTSIHPSIHPMVKWKKTNSRM